MKGKGTASFVLQRASAVVLIPLSAWFLVSLVAHAGDSYAEMRAWLKSPLASLPFAALIVVSAYHGRIGLEKIVEDYIHSWMKDVLIAASWIVALIVMAISVAAVYQLSFAG